MSHLTCRLNVPDAMISWARLCAVRVLKSGEIILLTRGDAAITGERELVSKVDEFREIVTSVGSPIEEERENVIRALNTEFDCTRSVISSAASASEASIHETLEKLRDEVRLALTSAPATSSASYNLGAA